MRTLQLLALAAFVCGSSASADTIELKTGERLDGAFKQATAAGAVIEVGGQAITIPLQKVRAIYLGAAPSTTVAAQSTLLEALDALKALRSVTNSGIAYRDYSQRVLDTRVKVDRYLASADKGQNESAQTRAVRVAMLEYELASQAWLVKIDSPHTMDLWRPMGTTMQDPEIAKCPIVKASTEFVDNPTPPAPSKPMERVEDLGLTLSLAAPRIWPSGTAVSGIWACASGQIAEAERSIAQH